MKPLKDLNLGFNDAENYKRKDEKELFNRVFLKTDALEKLRNPSTFFLIGEKGTGKTAHAMYLVNNADESVRYSINFLREAGYEKFVALKRRNDLELSDYVDIWKPILFLLLSEIARTNEVNLFTRFTKFRAIESAIDEFYENAFAPEIVNSIRFIEDTKVSAELLAKFATISSKAGSSESVRVEFSESKYQVNLLYIQRRFEEALSSLKLEKSCVLFIDGIDIRPATISYTDYLACIKGLANAVWSINNDFLANIKDSPGRMRIVLLVRPDIFDIIGMQNQNTKLQNNSVILEWLTTYKTCRSSGLFKIADRMLRWQQEYPLPEGTVWNYYFPYKSINQWTKDANDDPFVDFLRLSLYRPRDINTMLMLLKEIRTTNGRLLSDDEVFTADDVNDPRFLDKYSNYLLGEIKDQLAFYYSRDDYEVFREFFEYLYGKPSFNYDEFLDAYEELLSNIEKSERKKPLFLDTPVKLLQLLYELNVLCYREHPERQEDREVFIHWCFRERSVTNPAPKVKPNLEYTIHSGLLKALNLGKRVGKSSRKSRN
jgi:hypothetical protein